MGSRILSSVVSFNETKVLIAGGESTASVIYADFWLYETDIDKWTFVGGSTQSKFMGDYSNVETNVFGNTLLPMSRRSGEVFVYKDELRFFATRWSPKSGVVNSVSDMFSIKGFLHFPENDPNFTPNFNVLSTPFPP